MQRGTRDPRQAKLNQGGIKKQEKSPQEATNGGEIIAEGKKGPMKKIEEGGGAATKLEVPTSAPTE